LEEVSESMTLTPTDWRDLADGLVAVTDPRFPFDPADRPPDYGIRHKIVEDLWPLAVPVSTLRPLPKNPRRGDIEAMRGSLRTYGQRKPVVVNVGTDQVRDADTPGTVEAGNTTLAAARREGWTHLAIVRVRDDPTTETGFAVADNRMGQLGSFDLSLLADATARLEAADPALLLASGYDDAAYRELVAAANALRGTEVTDPAAEWAGMPDYENEDLRGAYKVIVHFRVKEDAARFFEVLGVDPPSGGHAAGHGVPGIWWPTHDGRRGQFSDEAWRAAGPEEGRPDADGA
jgi:hypothetical protein